MKHFALIVTSIVAALIFTSCCGSSFSSCDKGSKKSRGCAGCGSKQKFSHAGCEKDRYFETQVTEYVEEEMIVEGKGPKGGMTSETVTVTRPVVKTVREKIQCGDCGSKFCASPDCCGIVSKAVLSRATAQGGTGEPHLGTIPTMKVLVAGAQSNEELCPTH